ncbi:MAG: ATP-dependent zinc metalloprotease FtsH [Chlamydiae bacterium]|nr:ATP-dependent zinc metalloprotease FtsH [Chlamydiota bacterium]
MSDNTKKPKSSKKGLSSGFLIFLLASLLTFFTIQNFNEDSAAPVSFSHQLEHLVNLDLLKQEDNRKIALNDHLVTFTGKFKDRQSETAKARFRYLEFLDINHKLISEKSKLEQELSILHQSVIDSADWFLHLSGISIPKNGYVIVGSIYDTPEKNNSIVLRAVSNRQILSLSELEKEYRALFQNPTNNGMNSFGKGISILIQGFRSPTLGIGSQSIKQKLKDLQEQLKGAVGLSPKEKLNSYRDILNELNLIVQNLDQEQENIRLSSLRNVRNYKQTLTRFEEVSNELIKNQAQLDKARQAVAEMVWYFNNQELSTRGLEKQDPDGFYQWFAIAKNEWQNFTINRGSTFKAPDQPRNAVLEKTFKSEEPSPNYFSYLLTILPVLLVIFLLYFAFSRQMKGVGANAMNFGKSPARLLTKDKNKVTFKDVAGCDEAKEELQEIVEFLKDPSKFTVLGARIPKGVLCIGAPGTGKTLIAKAVAGEADRPFFFISGSDFVEMFVGVGASRIRDLFDQAKKHAPCIIFMDEIDAVGRHRGSGIGGGHDEREQTLNQLLVEMDGFDTSEGIILIAATNRPDVLDKALLRPGRFDRRIVIDLPDIKGRHEILKVHARKIKLDSSVELMDIARNTPGASGADLANILNEAALLAARRGRSAVTAEDTAEACDKVRYGKERRSLDIDRQEKRTTAIHEAGHAIVGLCVKHADPIDKVTIIPRGLSLGATHFMPKKNRLSYWKKELLDQLAVLMGGRVAEEMFVGDISSGAQMDISQATRLVRSMVCEWGMGDNLGAVAYDQRSEAGQYLGMPNFQEKNYSEATAKSIDDEVRKIVQEANDYAKKIITEKKDKLLLITDMLMEFEVLNRQDLQEIMDGQWDVEKKRQRLKSAEELHRKLPPPPPNPITNPGLDLSNPSPQQT